MSMHYSKHASTKIRVEYIGRQRRNDCIKIIQTGDEYLFTKLLSFSPDGTRRVSNSEQGVCVWEATSGRLIIGPLVGDDQTSALSAAYLPGGRYITIVDRDGIIRKWDALTNCLVWRKEIDEMQIDLSRVVSAVFSPGGNYVVVGDNQGTILVWNVDTGMQGVRLKGHSGSISCLSFSSDGHRFASGSDDEKIVVWNVNTRTVEIELTKRHTGRVTTVDFSPNRKNVISGSEDKIIRLWDIFTGQILRKIKCVDEVYSLTYSPDERFILAGGQKWMSMWNIADDEVKPKVFRVDRPVYRVSFSPDGSRFVFGSDGFNAIQIWDASWSDEETEAATIEEQGPITSISLSPSSELIVTASQDGSIYLWNVHKGEVAKRLKYSYSVNSVTFSPTNKQLIAFGSDDNTVQLWDIKTDESVQIGKHKDSVSSVVFSPTKGKHVASGSGDETICIWNVERRDSAVNILKGHKDYVLAVAYSPDGTRLVSGSRDCSVCIWNPETGRLLSTLNGHLDDVISVAYSFDGLRIVSGSNDKTIRVWNIQTGKIIGEPITRHTDNVNSVCFSPDGRRILSGSQDRSVRVWDALTGEPIRLTLRGHTDSINSVCFFSDGRRFVTGSSDGTIRIWALDAIPNNADWDLRDDNWVVGENGNLMMWIPTDLREFLCSQRNISVLNRPFYLKLHFDVE